MPTQRTAAGHSAEHHHSSHQHHDSTPPPQPQQATIHTEPALEREFKYSSNSVASPPAPAAAGPTGTAPPLPQSQQSQQQQPSPAPSSAGPVDHSLLSPTESVNGSSEWLRQHFPDLNLVEISSDRLLLKAAALPLRARVIRGHQVAQSAREDFASECRGPDGVVDWAGLVMDPEAAFIIGYDGFDMMCLAAWLSWPGLAEHHAGVDTATADRILAQHHLRPAGARFCLPLRPDPPDARLTSIIINHTVTPTTAPAAPARTPAVVVVVPSSAAHTEISAAAVDVSRAACAAPAESAPKAAAVSARSGAAALLRRSARLAGHGNG
jgi:hypothetical protein